MSAPLQTVASDIRSLSSHQRTMSTTEFDVVHPIAAKSALIQGRRHALSDMVNHSCSGGAPSEKTSSVDQGPLPTICSSADGTKLRPVEVHSATARTCLNVPSPEPVVPVPEDIPQSPEEKAGDLSMEVMHNKLDCSDELCVLSEEPLAVADDALEDSWLSSIAAPGMDHLAEGLSNQLELEFVKLRCDAPEWLEPVPDVPVPAVELSVDGLAGPDEEDLEMEAMHLYDDEEGFFDLPEEFKMEDKHFEVFRDVRGVRLHLRHSVAVGPTMPPEIALPPVLDLGYLEDNFVDLEAVDKPVPQSVLQCVPLD